MSVTAFFGLLTALSVVTSLCTEALKKLLDSMNVKYASNVLVCIVAAVVGITGTCLYYVICSLPFTPVNIVCVFLMSIATAVGSMVGYDKVMQAIEQIISGHK